MNQNEKTGGSTAKCQLTWVHAACSENPCIVVSEMNRSGLICALQDTGTDTELLALLAIQGIKLIRHDATTNCIILHPSLM